MFEHFDSDDKFLIYVSLLNSVRANSGHGFINGDQGHLAYRTGATGDIPEIGTFGDHPDHNRLYQMMRELSEALKDHPELPSNHPGKTFVKCPLILLIIQLNADSRLLITEYRIPVNPVRDSTVVCIGIPGFRRP